jgi:hypothetical protein
MDATERLVWDSDISVAVRGKDGDIMLIRLDGEIDHGVDALSRGYSYAGVLGRKDGQTHMLCEPGFDVTVRLARIAFAKQVAATREHKGDSVEFLEALYCLPDTRG